MNNIKELRKKKGLTQQQLADYLGIDRTSIGKYENNGVQPNNEVLFKMADLFEVSVDYLLGRASQRIPLPNIQSNASFVKNDILVPIVSGNITACCGNGNIYAQEVEWEIVGRYPIEEIQLQGYSWQTKGFYIIRASGESMEPIIYDKERVLFSEGAEISSGDIAILQWCDRLLIRAVIFDKENRIVLRAAKEGYQDIIIEDYDERFCIIGKVLKKIPDPVAITGIW